MALMHLQVAPRDSLHLILLSLYYGRPYLLSHSLSSLPTLLANYLLYLPMLRHLLHEYVDNQDVEVSVW